MSGMHPLHLASIADQPARLAGIVVVIGLIVTVVIAVIR